MVKSDTGNDPNIKPIIKTLDVPVLFKITTKNLKKKLLAEIAKDEPKLEKRKDANQLFKLKVFMLMLNLPLVKNL